MPIFTFSGSIEFCGAYVALLHFLKRLLSINNKAFIWTFFITFVMQIATSHLKVLGHFFEEPYKEVYLRELARKVELSIFSLKNAVDDLVEEGLLLERREGRLRYLKANMENLFFRRLKVAFNVKKILDSGIVNFLKESVPAMSSVVLFGSWAKGEDDGKSDIDILVIGQKPERINVSDFERRLGRKVELTILRWSEWRRKVEEDRAFYLEVITTGIVFHGNLPVIE